MRSGYRKGPDSASQSRMTRADTAKASRFVNLKT